MSEIVKKIIVISGANFYSGGTLSVMQDCLEFLENNLPNQYHIIALVGNRELFTNYINIEFIEFPKVRNSYYQRIFHEYRHYKKLSIELKPFLWLSINDMSSSVISERRAVYCHNPTPFAKVKLKYLYFEPSVFFFTLFYKFLYKININKNNFVIVQQVWLRNAFSKMFNLPLHKIIVAPPSINNQLIEPSLVRENVLKEFLFVFPTLPRPFKNIETIAKAAIEINNLKKYSYSIKITVSGLENNYAKYLCKTYKNVKQLDFIGLQTREKVYELYRNADALIFPSTLETWGMPITEFKMFRKPIFLSNLGYARETLGVYDKAAFFDPLDYKKLASLLMDYMDNSINYDVTSKTIINEPFAEDWKSLFRILLEH